MRKGGQEKLMQEGKVNGRKQHERRQLKYMEGLELANGGGTVDALQGWKQCWFKTRTTQHKTSTQHPKRSYGAWLYSPGWQFQRD